jgi:hypothetical protein
LRMKLGQKAPGESGRLLGLGVPVSPETPEAGVQFPEELSQAAAPVARRKAACAAL